MALSVMLFVDFFSRSAICQRVSPLTPLAHVHVLENLMSCVCVCVCVAQVRVCLIAALF
jgi:hypothetical protein